MDAKRPDLSPDSTQVAEPTTSKKSDSAATLRELAILFGAGFSLTSAVQQCGWGGASPFFDQNALELPRRVVAVLVQIGVGLLFATLLPVLLSRRLRLPRATLARLVSPAVLAMLVPILFDRLAWQNRELALLATCLAWGLGFERLLRVAFDAFREWKPEVRLGRWGEFVQRPVVGRVVVGLLVASYIARVAPLCVVSHFKMTTMSSDLAEFDNLFFNALHGHPFRAPAIEGDLQDWSALKVHAEFGLYLLLPFYALAPGPEALLWIQTVLVGGTAIPLYLLAEKRFGALVAIVFAFAFLATPAVARPNFYDFHFTPLGMFLVAWHFHFMDRWLERPSNRGRALLAIASFALGLLAREDAAIGLAVYAAFLVLAGYQVRFGLIALVSALTYFVVVKFGVMPRFGTMWFDAIYQDLKAPGSRGFVAVIWTALSNPGFLLRSLLSEPKALYLLHMIVPTLALWLRRPLCWLALLTGFVSTLLVTNRAPMFQSTFQYTYLWAPYVFGASIVALDEVRKRSASACTVVTAAAMATLAVGLVLGRQTGVWLGGESIWGGFREKTFEISAREVERHRELRELVALIPADASVAATEAEGPHVSTRLTMYSLKFTLGDQPDYLLLGHVGMGSESKHVRMALDSGEYGLVAQRGPFFLVGRGASGDIAPLSRKLPRSR